MEQCISTKFLPPKRRNRPWINKSISQCIRRKNAAFKTAKNTNSPRIWMHYKHIRNRVTSQLWLAKKKFFNNLNLSNPKSFWKSIKALDDQDTSVGTLNHNGNLCATDEQKANALNDYFTSCFNGSSPPVTTTTPDVNNECPSDILCTEEEIRTMLQSLDTSKANGLDGISACMLKSTAYSIAPSITKLFNHSIACGKPPSNWKKSAIVPIPKVSRARNTSDFRPISLLPILSKVLERHLVFYINSHLSEHSPLANCQWGFQKGKSTVSALRSACDT